MREIKREITVNLLAPKCTPRALYNFEITKRGEGRADKYSFSFIMRFSEDQRISYIYFTFKMALLSSQ